MRCCLKCFQHPWPRSVICEEGTRGKRCDYCESEDQRTLKLSVLYDGFQNLLEMYCRAEYPESGDKLIDMVQADWEVFSDELHESEEASRLLDDLANLHWDDDDGEAEIDSGSYDSSESGTDGLDCQWQTVAGASGQSGSGRRGRYRFHELFDGHLSSGNYYRGKHCPMASDRASFQTTERETVRRDRDRCAPPPCPQVATDGTTHPTARTMSVLPWQRRAPGALHLGGAARYTRDLRILTCRTQSHRPTHSRRTA
jgi:hypothetical protein